MDPIQAIAGIVLAIVTLISGVFYGVVPEAENAVPSAGVAQVNASASAHAEPSSTSKPSAVPSQQPFTGWPATGDQQVDFFCEAALAPFPRGNASPVLRKWAYSNPRIVMLGNPSEADLLTFKSCLDEINSLRTDYGDVDPREVDPDMASMANVVIYIGPPDQFPEYLSRFNIDTGYHNLTRRSYGDYDETKGGYKMWKDYNEPAALDKGTEYAVIVLPDRNLSQEERTHLIWRYMAAIFGAHGDVKSDPGSILSPANTLGAGYSEADRDVLRKLLNNKNIGPGMDYNMIVQTMIGGKSWAEVTDLSGHTTTFN
jgi:hypothetical protein